MNKNHLEWATLCGIAYSKPETAIRKYEQLGFEAKILNQPIAIEQVYCLKRYEHLFIVLTGSNQLKDWANNLFTLPGGYVHTGYCTVATGLMHAVESEFEESKCLQLWILGHSKGGGIAAILGNYLQHLPVQVVTYGAPRIASERYAATYNHDMYTRIVHPLDIVARLPFHVYGYRHCGKPVVFEKGYYDMSLKAWQEAQKTNPTIKLLLNLVTSIKAHFSYWDS